MFVIAAPAVTTTTATSKHILTIYSFALVKLSLSTIIIVKNTSQFETDCQDDSGYITQLKQQKSKRCYYLAAHRRIVNVLRSNITFLIFAVFVV